MTSGCSGCFGRSKTPPPATSGTTPEPDGTPVEGVIKPCDKRNFVIILAGPGKYNPKDPEHDQFWGNYFVAAQHVFGVPTKPDQFRAETSLLDGECVHWLVYEIPYITRWTSDAKAKSEFLIKEAKKYPDGYLTRIKQYIDELDNKHNLGKHKHRHVTIDSYKDVWEALYKLPDDSLTRMYYFGHGGPSAFYMRWARDFLHPAPPGIVRGDTTPEETIHLDKINQYRSWLTQKARVSDEQISKFYACTSLEWAKNWNSVTGLNLDFAPHR